MIYYMRIVDTQDRHNSSTYSIDIDGNTIPFMAVNNMQDVEHLVKMALKGMAFDDRWCNDQVDYTFWTEEN